VLPYLAFLVRRAEVAQQPAENAPVRLIGVE
jgi:hypothetical protein